MKKHLRRFLCFFLCFCLCFAYFGETQKAEAAGVSLAGIVLMYLLGCGFGFSVSGASTHLAEGITELTKEFIDNGRENIWEAIEAGVTVIEGGVLLFDIVATDALNSFVNWLRSDKGWTEGETVSVSNSFATWDAVIDGVQTIASSCVVTEDSTVDYDGLSYSRYFIEDEGTLIEYGSDVALIHTMYKSIDAFGKSSYFFLQSKSSTLFQYSYYKSGSSSSTTLTLNTYNNVFKAFGLSSSDIVGLTFALIDNVLYFGLYDGNGYFYPIRSYSENLELEIITAEEYSITVPSDLTAPDTSDWDAATSLGLFTGHSGKIPTSVEEYNDLVLQDINSGVIPEVTTDVIVGTPDQVLPDEEDGTLAGTVSGILAQVKALPQTLANLVLDGVKSIFIPDPVYIQTGFDDVLSDINEKYAFDFDMNSLFANEKEPEDIEAVYNYQIGGVAPVDSDSSNLLTFVSWRFLIDAVEFFRPFIRGWLILLLIFYNMKQFALLFNIDGLIGGLTPNEWNTYMTPKVSGDFSGRRMSNK